MYCERVAEIHNTPRPIFVHSCHDEGYACERVQVGKGQFWSTTLISAVQWVNVSMCREVPFKDLDPCCNSKTRLNKHVQCLFLRIWSLNDLNWGDDRVVARISLLRCRFWWRDHRQGDTNSSTTKRIVSREIVSVVTKIRQAQKLRYGTSETARRRIE